jgi:hypothetical protein
MESQWLINSPEPTPIVAGSSAVAVSAVAAAWLSLPVLEHAVLSIGIFSDLTWLFHAEIGGLRHD